MKVLVPKRKKTIKENEEVTSQNSLEEVLRQKLMSAVSSALEKELRANSKILAKIQPKHYDKDATDFSEMPVDTIVVGNAVGNMFAENLRSAIGQNIFNRLMKWNNY